MEFGPDRSVPLRGAVRLPTKRIKGVRAALRRATVARIVKDVGDVVRRRLERSISRESVRNSTGPVVSEPTSTREGAALVLMGEDGVGEEEKARLLEDGLRFGMRWEWKRGGREGEVGWRKEEKGEERK